MEGITDKIPEYMGWTECIGQLEERGQVRKEEADLLREILSADEIKKFLNGPFEKKQKEKLFEQMETFYEIFIGWDEEASRKEFQEFYELIDKYGENVEKYRIDKYEQAKVYLILYMMFQNKYQEFKSELDEKIRITKYGKIRTQLQSYCNADPIEDLVVSNVSKGTLYKKTPKDLKGKEEYNYDKEGRLLTFIWYHDQRESPYSEEFFLDLGVYLIRIRYSLSLGLVYGYIDRIVIQKYKGELILDSRWARLQEGGIPMELYTRSLEYADGILSRCMAERCYPPDMDLFFREEYLFQRDDEGLLYGYKIREWIGDGLKPDLCARHFGVPTVDKVLEIPEKKKRDTGREAGRWRKPVCPDI